CAVAGATIRPRHPRGLARALVAEYDIDSLEEDEVEQVDQGDHEGHEHQHHGRVSAHLLAGRPDDLPQLAPDLTEEQHDPPEKRTLLGRRRAAPLRRGPVLAGGLALVGPGTRLALGSSLTRLGVTARACAGSGAPLAASRGGVRTGGGALLLLLRVLLAVLAHESLLCLT